jgi:two-component sensor histidine kinase
MAERIQRVLTDELHHRMKNMLTVVAAIVRQTMRKAAILQTRKSPWDATSGNGQGSRSSAESGLEVGQAGRGDSIGRQAHGTASGRILVYGPELQIASFAILPLTLALNERCTNAAKYGRCRGVLGAST